MKCDTTFYSSCYRQFKGKYVVVIKDKAYNWDTSLYFGPLLIREGENFQFYPWDEACSQFYPNGRKIIVAKDDEHIIIAYVDPGGYSHDLVMNIQKALDSIHSEIAPSTRGIIEGLTPRIIILGERAKKKIVSIMKKESVNELVIERKYLPEIFSADFLEISKDDGVPTLKPFVIISIMLYGIMTEFYDSVIKFYKLKFSELEKKIIQMGGISTMIGTTLPYELKKIEEINSQLEGEIQAFLDWVKDSEGLANYINYYLQQNNTQVISKLSKIYKDLRKIFGIQ